MNPLEAYLKDLSSAVAKGNATEHIHRSGFKTIIESPVRKRRLMAELDQAIETSGGWLLQ